MTEEKLVWTDLETDGLCPGAADTACQFPTRVIPRRARSKCVSKYKETET